MDPFIRSFSIQRYDYDRSHTAGELQNFPYTCLGFVRSGHVEFLYKGRTYSAGAGDILYIAKGTTYYSIWNGNPEISFYSLSCEFQDPYAKQEYGFQVVNAPQLAAHFDRLYDQFQNGISFALLSDAYRLLDEVFPLLLPTPVSSAERPVLPAITHLEQHYAEPINVSQLAAMCGFSESRFFTLFKKATNCTPIEYKNNVLIQHALKLLVETQLTVEEISRFLGFSSPAYFRRVFYKLTGRTPKQLRQKH